MWRKRRMRRLRFRKRSRANYDQNDGVAGVVYIIVNQAFALNNLIKVGCSRRSGAARADELNKDATTGIPAEYECVWECKTLDCGRAEKKIHNALSKCRRGKWGQEWFNVDLDEAKSVIIKICLDYNDISKSKFSRPCVVCGVHLGEGQRDSKCRNCGVIINAVDQSPDSQIAETPEAAKREATATRNIVNKSLLAISALAIIGICIFGQIYVWARAKEIFPFIIIGLAIGSGLLAIKLVLQQDLKKED